MRGVVLESEYAAEVRPIRPGYSFGLARRTGTLGLVVVDERGDGAPMLLSSSHVMNQRADGTQYSLYQPGGQDRDRAVPPVAVAVRYTCLSTREANYTEGGLAALCDAGVDVEPDHPLGVVAAVCTELRVGMRLVKVSRTTGLSHGTIVDTNWSGTVRLNGRRFPFAKQLLVASDDGVPISLDGDSGAVWLTDDGRAAAMNFAGCRNGTVSVSTPAARLFRKLGVRLPNALEVQRWRNRIPSAS